jgi:hypothetical protein
MPAPSAAFYGWGLIDLDDPFDRFPTGNFFMLSCRLAN